MISQHIDYLVYNGEVFYPDDKGRFHFDTPIPADAQVQFVGRIPSSTCFPSTTIEVATNEWQS